MSEAPEATHHPSCPECGGRGWKVVQDGGAGAATPCDCRKRNLAPKLLELSDIPNRYRGCRLTNFQVNADPRSRDVLLAARRISEQYVDRFFDPKRREYRASGLLFTGPAGVGKTHLAAAVLTELIERYKVKGRFVDFTSLIYQIQSTFEANSIQTRSGVLKPVTEAEVLVLDELGAQKPTEFAMNTLYHIINTRYTEKRATLFTTNYALDRPRELPDAESRGTDRAIMRRDRQEAQYLGTRIPAPLLSRLHEMARTVKLDSTIDYRRLVKGASH